MDYNGEVERSVLGGILLECKAYDEAAALSLTAADFALDSHRRIYSRMVELAESSRPIACLIHIFEDNKGLLCYKHVVKTMFAATKRGL
jgi:replicative DNA helicase